MAFIAVFGRSAPLKSSASHFARGYFRILQRYFALCFGQWPGFTLFRRSKPARILLL